MRIKLFSVDSQSVKSSIILRTRAAAAFRPFSKDVLTFSDYLSFSDMAQAFDAALKKNDFIVVFASLKSYEETKNFLTKALHIKTEYRFDIFDLAGDALSRYTVTSPEAAVHVEMPVGAALFVPRDGLYSGFCVHSKKQYIMFLPLCEDITSDLLKGRVASFLNEITGFSDKYDDVTEFRHADICDILANAGAQVAIANTPAMDFICANGSKLDGFYRYFRVDKKFKPRKEESPKNYVIKLAIFAAKELNCPYGISLSNIFTYNTGAEKELKLYFAVTSSKTASYGQIAAEIDESIDRFLTRGVDELFSLLKKRLFDENPILSKY